MKDLIIILKILASVLIVFGVFVFYIMGLAIAGSSHNISANDRDNAIHNGYLSLIIGPILILCLWLPWTKWFNNKKAY